MNLEGTRIRLVETHLRTGSIFQTARLWGTSRAVVRNKWVRRYQEEGLAGLKDRSCRPQRSPSPYSSRSGRESAR
ncbi:helix-turn-helix domain-containing protein [Candidatus Hadarchaeum sp.]|uniref:helix-turn-helix domain-containing protein n=1 Tax=Candidatus Hadarchaeum sp. TaxID=2883567 RepID=UPI0038574882